MHYSFDSSELIDELEFDIEEYGSDLEVFAYWIVMPNGQEIYVDYYFIDGDELEEFGEKLSEGYDQFFRKRMPAVELLKKFKEEKEIL